MAQQVGPECELLIAENRVYSRCRGGIDDDLSTVVSAAHQELRWLQEDWVAVDATEVVSVDPTSGD